MPDFKFLFWTFYLVCFGWNCKPVSGESTQTDFKIAKPEQVFIIEIYRHGHLDQSLIKTKQDWTLNQKYKVRTDAIDNILRILPYIQVLYYPPNAAWQNMIYAIGEEGVKVVFKDASGDPIKSFSLGGMTNDERGTYAILEGSTKPYVIHVPGFDGSLANRFNMSDNEWRDRMIFNEKKEELKKVKVSYPADPDLGFELDNQDGHWVLFNHSLQKVKTTEAVIKTYLDAYTGVGAEGIENDYRHIPRVLESNPHAIIELYLLDDSVRTIKFYPVLIEGQTAVERFYVYDGKDFFLAQMRILQRIFRSIDSF